MALEGTLKDFALPDIFQLIGLQKKTGSLVLKNEQDEVTIAFKDGMLVHADSKQKRLEDRLGTVLVRSEMITQGQLADALEKQKQTLQRLGHIVVNDGLVKKEDLRRALELQVTQIIYRVFRWEDAYYRFDQEEEIDYDRENVVPIGAESILMEGMRVLDEWPIVEKSVPSMQTVYEKVPVNQEVEIAGAEKEFDPDDDDDFDFDLGGGGGGGGDSGSDGGSEKIVLSADEGRVYERLDGRKTLEDVMYLARLSEFDTAKAIYDMLSRDLVREAGTGGSAATSGAAGMGRAAVEASPAVVWSVRAVVAAWVIAAFVGVLVLADDIMLPWNGTNLAGIAATDLERQSHAAIHSRLERVAHVLEAHRLAQGTDTYVEYLDDLVALGLLRGVDIRNPWKVPFEYILLDEGRGYRLVAVDEEGQTPTRLVIEGGTSSTVASDGAGADGDGSAIDEPT